MPALALSLSVALIICVASAVPSPYDRNNKAYTLLRPSKNMEGEFIKVVAHLFGEPQQPILDSIVHIENPTVTTLRAAIAKAFKDDKPQLAFSADNHIHRASNKSGTNITSMLNFPIIRMTKISGSEVNVIIDNGSSSATSIQEKPTAKDAINKLNAMGRTIMDFVKPKYSLTDVHDFQERFNKRDISRERFLKANRNTPTYNDQILSGILTCMENPTKLGKEFAIKVPACGFHILHGEKVAREKAKEKRDKEMAASIDKGLKMPPEESTKKSSEESVLQGAINKSLDVFKFVHDHRSTMEPRNKSLWKTPILDAIKDTDVRGTKVSENRTINKRLDIKILAKHIRECDGAISAFPKWYSKKVKVPKDCVSPDRSIPRKGEAILYELENANAILRTYRKHLTNQASLNEKASNAATGSLPDRTNTHFEIVHSQPTRARLDKRTEDTTDLYERVDKVMEQVGSGKPYVSLAVDDDAMGISGPDWDDRDRCFQRRQFHDLLGSNAFKIGKFIYRPGCSVSNYVVIFKIDSNATAEDAAVQECRHKALSEAPTYLSRQETRDQINMI